MILQETKAVLEKHLGANSIQLLDEKQGIFRCLKTYNHSTYQVLYVDCSNVWHQDNFGKKELEKYQESILLKDYYDKPGSLQWNFYYAFIAEPKIIKEKAKEREEIEADELYTRKFIFSADELDKWLTRIDSLSKSSVTELEKDLSSIWINKLKENKLDAVFLNNTFVSGVDSYMDGEPILAPVEKETKKSKTSNVGSISFIDGIKLNKYRPHPIQREYEFGKVNLIKGANGCGKTSLLEAIELFLCGINNRNQGEATSEYDIKVKLSNETTWSNFSHGNIRLYKERDKAWYNNVGQKFNRLFLSFNKYNFYNTDAAYQLSNEADRANIKKAFEDIALGEEVNAIETRMKGFNERFYQKLNYYSNIVSEAKKEKIAESKLLKDISGKDTNPEAFFKELKDEVTKTIVLKISDIAEKHVPKLEKDINVALSYVSSIREYTKEMQTTSAKEIKQQLDRFTKCQTAIASLQTELTLHKKKLTSANKKTDELSSLDSILKQLLPFYKEKRLPQLIGISERIKNLRNEIANLSRLKEYDTKINFSAIRSKSFDTIVGDYELFLSEQISTYNNELKKLNTQKNSLLKGFNQLEQVISEIKNKGREYISLNPDALECPLCQADYTREQLISLINESQENIKSSASLDLLNRQIASLNINISALQDESPIIALIKQAAFTLFGKNGYSESIEKIRTEIKKALDERNHKETALQEFISTLNYFSEKELTEDLFANLHEKLEEFDVAIKDEAEFLAQQKQLNADRTANIAEIKSLKETIIKNENSINTLFVEAGISGNTVSSLKSKIESLRDALEVFTLLTGIVKSKDADKLSTIERSIEKLKSLIAQYKSIRKQKDEYDLRLKASNEKIKLLDSRIKENAIYEENAKKGYNIINDLLTNSSKSAYLEAFINNNKTEIVEIFKMIHSPKEFEDLIFGDNSEIFLKRIGNTKKVPLTEISTGQRSALSLAIFSALNRKLKNGPNILLFDDPVSNVDDLNILSYLDYLREVAINGNRQIFFATANDNIAFLFSQKFKFLDSDFKVFELSRQ